MSTAIFPDQIETLSCGARFVLIHDDPTGRPYAREVLGNGRLPGVLVREEEWYGPEQPAARQRIASHGWHTRIHLGDVSSY
jgi:hypothetical protein